MKPTFQWVGNLENKTGAASYRCGDEEHILAMASFAEANELNILILKAYQEGARDGQAAMMRAIATRTNEVAAEW